MTLEEMSSQIIALMEIASEGQVRVKPIFGGKKFTYPPDFRCKVFADSDKITHVFLWYEEFSLYCNEGGAYGTK